MKTIDNLSVYNAAREFRIEISQLTKFFPSEEKFRLKDQILRSSRSISAQIAEGHGRFSFKENIQYLRIARGSLVETLDHLAVALDEGYIQPEDYERLRSQLINILKMLNGYINYCKSKVS